MKTKNKLMNKKGQIQMALYGLLTLGLFIIVVGYIFGFGQDFLDDSRQLQITNTANCGRNSSSGTGAGVNYAACGAAYNITLQSQDAMVVAGSGQGTIATVGILVIVVGLLVGVIASLGFAGQKNNNF